MLALGLRKVSWKHILLICQAYNYHKPLQSLVDSTLVRQQLNIAAFRFSILTDSIYPHPSPLDTACGVQHLRGGVYLPPASVATMTQACTHLGTQPVAFSNTGNSSSWEKTGSWSQSLRQHFSALLAGFLSRQNKKSVTPQTVSLLAGCPFPSIFTQQAWVYHPLDGIRYCLCCSLRSLEP